LLSIVIPAYNEERRLPATLDRVMEYLAQRPEEWEILVVNDGSRDNTAGLVESYSAKNQRVRLLNNPGNLGKGYAVRNGMLAAQGDWILFTDSDLSSPIEELEKLEARARLENADVAIGSRAIDRKLVGVHQPAFRELSGRVFNLVMRLVTGLPFHDTQCGFKLYKRSAAQAVFRRQILDGFSFDVEDLWIAKDLGLRVVEVGVRWNNVEGTKVSAMTGVKSFLDLMTLHRYRLEGRYR
jgi:glycosyltransferase involved in cell wall biosynthesis